MTEKSQSETDLQKVSNRLSELEKQSVKHGRGIVDTLATLAPLISGVLIAGVGTVATVLYNERQLQLTQLTALDKYRGYLASKNPQERIFGYEAFIALGQEEFVVKLIGAKRDVAAKEVLTTLVEVSADDGIRQEASKSLKALGSLSAEYESTGNAAAIGRDPYGGWSYGMYQLRSATGAVTSFLELLRKEYPNLAAVLDARGGDESARQGTEEFREAWRELAKKDDFTQAQHRFIEVSYFSPAAEYLLKETNFDVRSRSSALQNVLWSLAVQHGPNGAVKLIKKAIGSAEISDMEDSELIDAIYDERSRVNVYFRGTSPAVKRRFLRRFLGRP